MTRIASLLAVAAFVVLTDYGVAPAQSPSPRLDVGGHFTFLRATVNRLDSRVESLHGFGGRLSYNVSKSIAIEGEINYFPENITEQFSNKETRPAKPDYQALFGIKVGRRGQRIGVFGKFRPGFARFSPLEDCSGDSASTCRDVTKTKVAFDLGAVVELYPTRRTLARFDLGGGYLHYGQTRFFVSQEPGFPGGIFARRGFHSFGLQFSVGFGLRF